MSKGLLHTIVSILLFALSLGFHTQHLDFASYELDEAVHLWFAQMPYDIVVEKAADDPNPPIYNLLISAWVKQFGVHEASTRMFSAIAGSLSVVLMFIIGTRNFGFSVGLFAALFFCFSPVQYRFTHMARPYSLLMLVVVSSYGFLFEWLNQPRKTRVGLFYYLSTTLMIYVHPTSVFNIPAQGLILLIAGRKSLRNIGVGILPLVLAFGTYLIWFLVIPYFERSHQMWFEPPSWNDIVYVLKVFYGNFYLIVSQALLLLLILWRRKKIDWTNSKFWVIAIWATVPFISSIGFSYFLKPIFQDKYILSVQPGMMLLFSLAVMYAFQKLPSVKWVFGLGVVLSLGFSVLVKPPPFGGDWKGVVSFVNENKEKEDATVLIEPEYEYRTFAFYYNQSIYEKYNITINLLGDENVFTGWSNIYDERFKWPKHKYIYLVHSFAHETLAELSITNDYLDSIANCIELKNFHAIKVSKYKFQNPLDYYTDNTVVESFDNEDLGKFSFTKGVEYSSSIELPLFILNQDSISITCSIDVRSAASLKGGELLITLETENAFVLYDSWKIEELARVDTGWQTISQAVINQPITSDTKLKVFVANPNGDTFEIDNLTVKFED